VAEEDFELVLRRRRSEETAASARLTAEAEASAAQTIADAQTEAEGLVAGAIDEVQRLQGVRDELRGQLEELHAHLGETIARAKDATGKTDA
jgi:regulator of protease activity HflC (stomatin/prohibitin superfamily)